MGRQRSNRPFGGKNDSDAAKGADQTTPSGPPPAGVDPAAHEALRAEHEALRGKLDQFAERLRAAEGAADGLRTERADLTSRLRDAEASRDDLAARAADERRLAERLRSENERLVSQLREAETAQAGHRRLFDGLRDLARVAGLDHLPTPEDFVDSLKSRLGALKGREGSGFTGVKRFQGHGTFLRGKPTDKDREAVTLTPNDAIPDDVDLTGVDPRLITVE